MLHMLFIMTKGGMISLMRGLELFGISIYDLDISKKETVDNMTSSEDPDTSLPDRPDSIINQSSPPSRSGSQETLDPRSPGRSLPKLPQVNSVCLGVVQSKIVFR